MNLNLNLNSRKVILVIFIVILAVIILLFATTPVKQDGRQEYNQNFLRSEIGTRIPIKRIRVISGCEYDLKLEDGRRILGHLCVTTPDDDQVRTKVIKFLNSPGVTSPEVVLLEKHGEAWKVQVYLNVGGSTVQLSQWLRDNGLVWE